MSTVDDIRDAGKNELLVSKMSITTTAGEPVADAYSTIVSRGTASSNTASSATPAAGGQ